MQINHYLSYLLAVSQEINEDGDDERNEMKAHTLYYH